MLNIEVKIDNIAIMVIKFYRGNKGYHAPPTNHMGTKTHAVMKFI